MKKAATWGDSLASEALKTNNHAATMPAKIELRRRVLEAIGADNARVFDAFAGDGKMFDAVWSKAARYVGCDLEWYRDAREAFVADNRRVLRSIDLTAFNVFDLDAWGAPWEQAIIVAARRPVKPGERIGMVLTEGSGLKLRVGDYPLSLRAIAGIRGRAAGGSRSQDELMARALAGLCRRMRCTIAKRWQAKGKTGAAMIYAGLVLEGDPL